MSVATLAPSTALRSAYGRPAHRPNMAPTVTPARVANLDDALANAESWARLSLGVAVAFAAGLLTYNLAPFVGWSVALADSLTLTALVGFACVLGHILTPYVERFFATAARDFRRDAHTIHALAWSHGLIRPAPPAMLPPLITHPGRGRTVILPWHHYPSPTAILVRRTRIARPVTTVLFYDHGHVAAVGHVKAIHMAAPRQVARTYATHLGMTADAFRDYTAGHERVCVIELDGAWACPPFSLEAIGIRGPLGAHRYLNGGAS